MEKKKTRKPSIGAMVHYTAYNGSGGTAQFAAIITSLKSDKDTVNLCAFSAAGIFFYGAKYSEKKKPGTWSWPRKI